MSPPNGRSTLVWVSVPQRPQTTGSSKEFSAATSTGRKNRQWTSGILSPQLRAGKAHSRSLGYARDDKFRFVLSLTVVMWMEGPAASRFAYSTFNPTSRLLLEAPPHPLSSRAYSGFPLALHQSTATYAAFRKESRTRFVDTTGPD